MIGFSFTEKTRVALVYTFFLLWVVYLLSVVPDFNQDDRLIPYIVISIIVILLVAKIFEVLLRDHIVSSLKGNKNPIMTNLLDKDEFSSGKGYMEKFDEKGVAEGDELKNNTESVATDKISSLFVIGWLLPLPVFIHYFGFLVTLPAYTFIFSFYFTRNIKGAVGAAIAITVIIYLLFIQILNAYVWEGIIW